MAQAPDPDIWDPLSSVSHKSEIRDPRSDISYWPHLCREIGKPGTMIEKQEINGREVWLKVEAHPVQRENPNIIPNEYFTVSYYMEDPEQEGAAGVIVQNEEGEPRLFESPVAALSGGRQRIETDHSGAL